MAAVGDYFVIVRTDASNRVLENPFEDNNDGVSLGQITITVNPNPDPNLVELAADLVVESVDAPAEGFSGQTLEVSWTVRNQGEDTGDRQWFDSVYLSRDQVFDPNSDIFLRSLSRSGLAAGESYTQTAEFTIDRGLSGPFYVFVNTDSNNRLNEPGGELNNSNYDRTATEIILLPPTDLVAGTITIPSNGSPGQEATLTYTVENQSSQAARGRWTDSLYISQDEIWDVNDPLFSEVTVFGPVESGQSYSNTVTAALPGLVSGDYHVIVRSDIRNNIAELDEQNNLAASLDQFNLDIAQLALDTPTSGVLGEGESVYYRIDVEAGETLLVNFDSDSIEGANELYLRYGDVPSRSTFDLGFTEAFAPDQEIIVPNTLAGSYYVLAFGDSVPEDSANFTIEADSLEFSLLNISTEQGSNQGEVTLVLEGARLTPTTDAILVANDGSERIANNVIWKNDTELWATFDLRGLSEGNYDIRLEDTLENAALEDSFTVTSGPLGTLETQLIFPSALRPGQSAVVTVNYANAGETDIVAPILTLSADNALIQVPEQAGEATSTVQFLGINPEGPAGILSPGARGSFSVIFDPIINDGQVNFLLSELASDENATNNLADSRDEARPINISEDAWDIIWNNFVTEIGSSVGQYQAVIAENATYLSRFDERTNDVNRLQAFELRQANDTASYTLLSQDLVSKVDAFTASPELPLSFARQYRTSIDGRFMLGAFGFGWTHQWDSSLSVDGDGNVTIIDSGDYRFFARNADGTYQAQGSDQARLTQETDGTFRLREPDESVVNFRLDGKLGSLEDLNGNRINASYTEGVLTQLTHANGDTFSLTYNDQGRIDTLTDQAGRTTIYEYDATGEHLLSASGFDGTIIYTYDTTPDIASEHALTSVTFADGSQTAFEYDDKGRLSQQSQNNGLQAVTYTYDSTGEVTATDASGATNIISFLDKGPIGLWQDALGQLTQFRFDDNGNLIGVIDADQTVSAYGYNDRADLSQSIDSLGNLVNYTYDPIFDALAGVEDSRRNVTSYGYDDLGNLESISYADGSTETFGYDELGNLTISVNRRDQGIDYTYNEFGFLLRKDYADGSFASFTYDERGNLLSAVDDDSSVVYEYDSGDRITRVTDDTGRFLTFTYNSGGLRSQIADQDGFTVNYAYDDLGQLTTVTDINDAVLVSYDYDAVGRLARENNGNGTYTTYDYDLAGQLLSLVNFDADDNVNSQFDYTYDAVGRRTSLTSLAGTTTYRYDSIGQLVGVTLPDESPDRISLRCRR